MKQLDEVKDNKDLMKMIEDYEEEIIEYIDASFSSLKNGLVIFL
jgi:hypothetical protein